MTQLATYLTLYRKARTTSYIEYMRGAKLLADWLAPIELPERVPLLPHNTLLTSYETSTLAAILSGEEHGTEHTKWLEAIIYIEIQELYK